MDLVFHSIYENFALSRFEAEELVPVGVHFHSDLFAWLKANLA